MRTVTELALLAHVSVRTLHHYDAIGLLKPTQITDAGYRLYDDAALERLYLILLFRELEFPLKQIQGILDAPDFDRNRILEQQIKRLKLVIREELTELQRDTIQAYYFENKTLLQIAEERNVNKSTVFRTLKRAEDKLRRFLQY